MVMEKTKNFFEMGTEFCPTLAFPSQPPKRPPSLC